MKPDLFVSKRSKIPFRAPRSSSEYSTLAIFTAATIKLFKYIKRFSERVGISNALKAYALEEVRLKG